ncbi:F-box domain containing protein [Trema orientale]|uniref:F-box domain containing protein n=1 Tax=Trema orientale TaxID=63057 RepID=A0A2P5E668_TREOI|nr:F-box domain containing protein [Trema orientale]
MSKSRSTRIDRLSSLPEHVAHKVFSSLSMEDIFRLSSVSRRCWQLCISIPFLIFDDSRYQSSEIKRTRLLNNLERMLVARQGMDTESFNIRWSLENYGIEEERRVLSWLHTVVKCNVKQLDLDIVLKSEAEFALPHSLLSCLLLESLTLKFKNGIGILNIPSSISCSGFSSLKSLELKSVRISDSFGDWVSSYCRVLTKLSLIYTKGAKSIIITSSSLETLKIWLPDNLFRLHVSGEILSYVVLHWTFDSFPNTRDLQLSTPRLEELFWAGNFLNCGILENYTSLVKAHILLFSSCSFTSMVQYLDCVLRLVHNVRHLSLNEYCLNEYDKTKECCDFENVPFLHNLKSVMIELPRQGENDLKLINYLLKHAENLQKMTASYGSPLRSDLTRMIAGYDKASSDAEVNIRRVRFYPKALRVSQKNNNSPFDSWELDFVIIL